MPHQKFSVKTIRKQAKQLGTKTWERLQIKCVSLQSVLEWNLINISSGNILRQYQPSKSINFATCI